jgi:hypothetical protein
MCGDDARDVSWLRPPSGLIRNEVLCGIYQRLRQRQSSATSRLPLIIARAPRHKRGALLDGITAVCVALCISDRPSPFIKRGVGA